MIPAGTDVTVPEPVPALMTDTAYLLRVKVGVTVVASLRLTTHVPVPVHPPPDQPVKLDPVAAAAVRVMVVP